MAGYPEHSDTVQRRSRLVSAGACWRPWSSRSRCWVRCSSCRLPCRPTGSARSSGAAEHAARVPPSSGPARWRTPPCICARCRPRRSVAPRSPPKPRRRATGASSTGPARRSRPARRRSSSASPRCCCPRPRPTPSSRSTSPRTRSSSTAQRSRTCPKGTELYVVARQRELSRPAARRRRGRAAVRGGARPAWWSS